MSIFKAVVSGTWALFLGVLVPKHSIALADVVTVIESIQSCDKLSETYDAAGADIVVRLEGDMACAKAKTVRVSGEGYIMFSFQHAVFTNVLFIVDEKASMLFACDSVRFDVEVPGQQIFDVRGNLDFVAGTPSPYFTDFVDANKDDVYGLVKASGTAKIHFFKGIARYSETSILVENPLPVRPSDQPVVGKDASYTSQPSGHKLDQLSLEQPGRAELPSAAVVLGSAHIDSDIDSDITATATATASASASASAGQQSLDGTIGDAPVDAAESSTSGRSNAATIATCDHLASSYTSTRGQEFTLFLVSDTITCTDKKVVHIVGDGVVNLTGGHVTLYNVSFVVGNEAMLSLIAQSVKFDSTQEPRTPILEVHGMVYSYATRISPHHVDGWKEDRQGLVSLHGLGELHFAAGHLTYTDAGILLEGTSLPYDATESNSGDDSSSAASTGTGDALPFEHDVGLPDSTAAADEVSEVSTADVSPDGSSGCSEGEGHVAAEESSEDGGALSSDIPVNDGNSSVYMSPPPPPPTGEDNGDAAVDTSADQPSSEDDTSTSENSSAQSRLSPQLARGVKEVGMPTGCSEDGGASCMGSTTPIAVTAATSTDSMQSDSGRVEAVRSDADSTRTITEGLAADGVSSVEPVDLQWDGMMAEIEHTKQFATSVSVHVSGGSSDEITAPASLEDSSNNGENDAASDSGELSPPSPSTSVPPFLRAGPIKANLPSLKVGQSLKLPEKLVSPQGGAAISLGPDGSMMSSKISQTSAAPAELAPQDEKESGDAEQNGARDAMEEFLVSSNWRKVSRVLKERDYSRNRAAATGWIGRSDKVSAKTAEPGSDEGDTDVRGKVRRVGVGVSAGNRWWDWKGNGNKKVDRTEKWRFWGARGAQRREVPSPDAAGGEDVVMSITDKAVIEVKMDGARVLTKAGPSKFELINKFRCLMRKRCDGYEAFAEEDGGVAVCKEDGGLVYRITGPDDF